jgi:hypothetical protein
MGDCDAVVHVNMHATDLAVLSSPRNAGEVARSDGGGTFLADSAMDVDSPPPFRCASHLPRYAGRGQKEGLGRVLVQAVPVPKRGSIVRMSVLGRQGALRSRTLTTQNRRPFFRRDTRQFRRVPPSLFKLRRNGGAPYPRPDGVYAKPSKGGGKPWTAKRLARASATGASAGG